MVVGDLLSAAENMPVEILQLQKLLEREADSQHLSASHLAGIGEYVLMKNIFLHSAEGSLDSASALQESAGHLMEDLKKPFGK